MRPLVATYRLQLRQGVDFDAAQAFLPWLERLGVSHLYLSPIFTAAEGSTHGYDVTDPSEIDPALGGEEAFARLARAASDRGLGIVLDIVPNHTAFTPENPWLRDVLRHGSESRYAGHFDLDLAGTDEGLVLPVLAAPFETLLEEDRVGIDTAEDGPVMTVDGFGIPIATEPPSEITPDTLRALHEAQPWRLIPWQAERDRVTHRRFFNVTGLIGMRVEDEAVFEDMHRKTFELIEAGLVDALRLDHVDGLADPGGYLDRLRDRVGPEVPIWVEKILTGDEALPDWPVEGTTGYEAARQISRLLTDASGEWHLRALWRAETRVPGVGGAPPPDSFHDALLVAKDEVMRRELAAELHQLIALAQFALMDAGAEIGPEVAREAVLALLVAFPRYRTYLTDGETREEDVALLDAVAEEAGATLQSDEAVMGIRDQILHGRTEAARALRVRFQQVTGALLAKAHEDTAGFRWNAALAANEVGADPDEPTIEPGEMEEWLRARGPDAMTLTSSHDTKRSEDARMRLVAMAHDPDAYVSLWRDATALPEAEGLDRNMLWYLTQSALAVWDKDDADLGTRLTDHMMKALREGKQLSTWTHPDEELEAAFGRCAEALVARWREAPPAGLAPLVERGAALSLVQTAMKFVMPGVPDIYQGCETRFLALTDPDNRSVPDPERLAASPDAPGFPGEKARLTLYLLRLRGESPELFRKGSVALRREGEDTILERAHEGRTVCLRFGHGGAQVSPGRSWPTAEGGRPGPVAVDAT